MGRGNSKTAPAVGNTLKTRKDVSKNIFSEKKDYRELMASLDEAKEALDIEYVQEVLSRIPDDWKDELDESSSPAAVTTRLKAFSYYDKYRIDPYRLQRRTLETSPMSDDKRPFRLALDTLVSEESEPFVEPLEAELSELSDKDRPQSSADEIAKETMLLIYASKNTYSPKLIRKHFMGNLSQKATEAVVETFSSYSYTPPENEMWPV